MAQGPGTIARLNRLSRQRFKDAFDRVNEIFHHTFPRLFHGGKAWLTLTDENKLVQHAARAFAEACGKDPVEVKDQAGFIVNALLFPYLNNAVRILENGTATREDIDTAMKGGCNFPMGPLELLDLVGLDTSVSILDALYDEFRDPHYAAVPLLRRMVTADQLGRKTGQGFYEY